MNLVFAMLADADPDNLLSGKTDPRLYPMLALLGALALAVVVATIWAVYYSRKKKRPKHRRHHHRHSKASSGGADENGRSATDTKARKKWRKPRRPHRPLNPTLAQVGGLPPVRDENTPLPPMP